MDLRELQRTGRIGRIDVSLRTKAGKTNGTITIPSSLDSTETALIAACIETIERIGPCNARVYIGGIEDVRTAKRKYVIERARGLLSKIFEQGAPEAQELKEQLLEAVRSAEISNWNGLPAGPGLDSYDSIIVVEGRADVIHLLKHGIKNVIAIDGTSIPAAIKTLSRRKELTAFLDGDRGADLILKELLATCELDFVARAPRGREVEELSKKELFKALRERIPADQCKIDTHEKARVERRRPSIRKPAIEPERAKRFRELLTELTGSHAAYFMTEDDEVIGKVPVKEIHNTLRELQADWLVLDGDIDQRLVSHAAGKGIKWLIGMRCSARTAPKSLQIVTLADLQV
jgi:DNA primase